jgi:tetratricopeptide (TPR) repeat protein
LKPNASPQNVIQSHRKGRIAIVLAVAAAALWTVSLAFLRFSSRSSIPALPKPNQAQETVSSSSLKPVLGPSAQPGQPILLAVGLQLQSNRREDAPVFRGQESHSRPPRPSGSIVSIEEQLATVDLGALDGIAKGSELLVFLEERSTQPIGRLRVTTVFRERARGMISGGQGIQVNHRVRVSDETHLDALLQQVEALSRGGRSDAARAMAVKAVGWAETASVSPAKRVKALELLASLEYQAGDLGAAEQRYQSAADTWKSAPPGSHQLSVALNNLAVLRLLRGDYEGAEAPLHQAVARSSQTPGVYARAVNNLAVVAEVRGDRQKAETLYTDALRAFAGVQDSPEQDRRAVEANLSRLRNVR